MAKTVSELPDLPASELRRLVAARRTSAAEVVDACLDRAADLNPLLNAVVTLNPDALADARELDRRLARGDTPGLLCGLPVGIKDVTPVEGLRTTFGSPIYADH